MGIRIYPGCIIDTFIDATGEAVVNGRLWKWEFHEYLGPTFLKRDGEPRNKYPSERHPVWDAFQAWLGDYYEKKGNKEKAAQARSHIRGRNANQAGK